MGEISMNRKLRGVFGRLAYGIAAAPKLGLAALIAGQLVLTAQAANFSINSTLDARDSNLSDGLCATASSQCSLRAAIEQANALDGNDVIELPAGDYLLSLIGANEDASASGDLDITSTLAILASDAGTTRILGSSDRVLDVQLGAVASLTRVTLSSGGAVSTGGGIRNAGTLVLSSCVITGNGGDTRTVTTGAGVFNLGVFTMVGGEISNNQAQATGLIPVSGGGAYSTTGMILTGVRIENNRALGNTASGGGLSALAPGVVQLISSGVVGNQAAFGGGIAISGADVTISSSLLAGNTATRSGAGARVQGGVLNLNNVTISGNSAAEDAGGVLVTAGELNTFNATLSNNSADTDANNSGNGGGIAQSGSGTVRLKNTLLAKNIDASATAIAPDCSGTMTSSGFNLLGSSLGCAFTSVSGDQLNLNPLIGPLADNNGVTLTHALLTGSAAIDAGDSAGCMSSAMQTLLVDQRALPRPRDGNNDGDSRCDIGAFELQPPLSATAISIVSDTPDPSVSGQPVQVTFSLTSSGAPTGVVTVSASTGESCTATLPATSCFVMLLTSGARLLSASYPGDSTFAASTSITAVHQVNLANSVLSALTSAPNPSQTGQAVTVSWTLAAVAPGAGTLTGSVVVTASGGTESCTAVLPQNSCQLTLSVIGARTLTLNYSGDSNFNSATASRTHTVNGVLPELIFQNGFE
jgi:hypothetical protein